MSSDDSHRGLGDGDADAHPHECQGDDSLARQALPRRPGIWPDDFPTACALRRAPTPGQPLPPEEQCPHLIADRERPDRPRPIPAPVSKPSSRMASGAGSSKLWRATTSRSHIPVVAPLTDHTGDFPPLDCAPPKLELKQRQYPSGNPTGTAELPAFEARVRELLTAPTP
jgi:hypothetical protein